MIAVIPMQVVIVPDEVTAIATAVHDLSQHMDLVRIGCRQCWT